MKIPFALAALIFITLAPERAQAEPGRRGEKKAAKKEQNAQRGIASGQGAPSARIEPVLVPALNAILAPLEKNPAMPRVQVETLRASFGADVMRVAAPGQGQIYQNAMAVCDALTRAMDDRAKAKSDALASAKMHSILNGLGINKSSPMHNGRAAEAVRKKQRDERSYADDLGHQQSAFV